MLIRALASIIVVAFLISPIARAGEEREMASVELSEGQIRALAIATAKYEQWKEASNTYFCEITSHGDHYLILIRPYSSEELRDSVFGEQGDLREGLSIAYEIDKRTLRVTSEKLQR